MPVCGRASDGGRPHSLGPLLSRRDDLLRLSLAASSWKSYRSAWRSYSRVLAELQVTVMLPLQEQHLELYVTSVSRRLAHNTIKSYLSAIKFIHVFRGFNLAGLFGDRLRLLVRAVKREQGPAFTRPRRLPITSALLSDLFFCASRSFSPFDAALFKAAFSLAFFGLLRVSEFTCPSSSQFSAQCHLGLQDIVFDSARQLMLVRIKVSKTDPFRAGAVVRIASSRHPLCATQAMSSFLRLRRPLGPGPLFILSNGQFLTRHHIVQLLALAFPEVPQGALGSHSFRIGGASMLCALGVPDATIQILGRWSSSAFKKYLHLSDEYIVSLHPRMVGNAAGTQVPPITGPGHR